MNFNISPIAFYSQRDGQMWRNAYNQRNIAVVVGEDLPPFIINNAPAMAPTSVEIYDPNTNTLVATINDIGDILSHTSTVNGVSVNSWIYQGNSSGIWGFNKSGYYYLKIGNYYSDIIKLGPVNGDYVKLTYQFYDDIITADGTLISKYIVYKQIFETVLWHPNYEISEEGKENNGIFYAMQQITKKQCGFNDLVNEAQLDTLNLTRMADNVQIESRSNGVVRTFTTNTFEIRSNWESDDVASIEVTFDLFNIVMKCQQTNVAPEPLPIPVPPTPPSNYKIKGKSTANSLKLKINGTVETIPVYNGEFEFGYDAPITSICTYNTTDNMYRAADVLQGVSDITELDLSECDGLETATIASFAGMANCTKADFTNCTFGAVEIAGDFLNGAKKLTSVLLSDATFANVVWSFKMFANCQLLKTISMPKATIVKLTGNVGGTTPIVDSGLFEGCKALETINIPLSTFADYQNTNYMFGECDSLKSVNMPLATFASATRMRFMFYNARVWDAGDEQWQLTIGDLFPALAAQPTSVSGMFNASKAEYIDITALDLSACTEGDEMFADSTFIQLVAGQTQFDAMTDISQMFKGCTNIQYATIQLLASMTFANATNVSAMFKNADVRYSSKAVSLDDCTFASATNAESMFEGCKFVNIILPSATFASVTNANKMFYNCTAATYITLTAGTFASVTTADSFMMGCNALTNLTVPNSSTWPKSFSLAQSASLNLDSFERIVDWVKDVSGGTAQTFTANATAKSTWQQSMMRYMQAVTSLNGKNWNIQ